MLDQLSLTEITSDEIAAMSDEEILQIICDFSAKRHGGEPDPSHDHRRFLSRPQLERLVTLIQGECRQPAKAARFAGNSA
jgi:hypothetical protein